MRCIDPDCVCRLGPNAINGGHQAFAQLAGQDASRDRDAAEIRHLVRANGNLVARKCAGRGAQHQVEDVLRVDSQSADLGALHRSRPRNVASLLSIAEEREGDDVGSTARDDIPFQDDRGLCGIATAQSRWDGFRRAKGGVDAVLQRGKVVL